MFVVVAECLSEPIGGLLQDKRVSQCKCCCRMEE